MPVTWRVTFDRWRRFRRRGPRAGGSSAARPARPASPGEAEGFAGSGWRISEADLHGYIDGDPATACRADLEAFLAAHPLIADRLEAYRSHIVAVNAAFGAGQERLPPALAAFASRYGRAVAASSLTRTALGILGSIGILCIIAGPAYGG